MTRHDALHPREPEAGAPIFAEAWQAQALAIAYVLTNEGLFSARAWPAVLGAALRASEERGEPDDEEHYYEAVLAALESLVGRQLPEIGTALVPRHEQWRRAYLNTPHGQPVELKAGAEHE